MRVKTLWMAGAAFALVQAPVAAFAANDGSDTGGTQPSNEQIEQHLEEIESELQTVQLNEQATATKVDSLSSSLEGWWDNTKIGSTIFYDLTYAQNINCTKVVKDVCTTSQGDKDNGFSFDIKRFYIQIDHKFDDNWSAELITDANYQSSLGQTSLFIKKAFVQWTLDPKDPWLNVRVGSADMPWIPYSESVYGYRFVENVLVDRVKFGNSADWGVHVFGNFWDNLLAYQVSAVSGAGYKKPLRSHQPDFEGRISLNWMGFQAGIGGYDGTEGASDFTAIHHHYTRFDALAAYSPPFVEGLKVGFEYFDGHDHGQEGVVFKTLPAGPVASSADGFSPFASWQFLPEWSVFGRYDYVRPLGDTAAHKEFHNDYFNVGVDFKPIPQLDFALVYKNDSGTNGFFNDQNAPGAPGFGQIGGTAFALGNNGTYQEIGLFGKIQF